MTPRFDDQDVAALYCGMRDGIAAVAAITWWQRLLDFIRPAHAALRRLNAIESVYRQWQADRPAMPEAVQPLDSRATAMALSMVRHQRRGEHYAQKRVVEVTEADTSGHPLSYPRIR